MGKNDDLKIDILDIFGEDWAKPAATPPPPAPAPVAPEPPPAPAAVIPEPPTPEPEVRLEDLAITPSVPEPAPEPAPETPSLSTEVPAQEAPAAEAPTEVPFVPDEFLTGYDGFRTIMLEELQGLVGEKKSYLMLGRTFELGREKFPQIFRNANWDENGNLREDGSLDQQRILANKNTVDPAQADITLDSALITLLNIRLQAIEKGLGVEVRTRVRSRMKKWIADEVQSAEAQGRDASPLRRLNHYLL